MLTSYASNLKWRHLHRIMMLQFLWQEIFECIQHFLWMYGCDAGCSLSRSESDIWSALGGHGWKRCSRLSWLTSSWTGSDHNHIFTCTSTFGHTSTVCGSFLWSSVLAPQHAAQSTPVPINEYSGSCSGEVYQNYLDAQICPIQVSSVTHMNKRTTRETIQQSPLHPDILSWGTR